MGSTIRESEMESRIRRLESDLRSATSLKAYYVQRQVAEADDYSMSHRNEEVLKEGILLKRSNSSRSGSYQYGSSDEHLLHKINFLEEQIRKVEQKLEKANESLILEKEKSRMLQADLLRHDEEMRIARNDLRIARRVVTKLAQLEEGEKPFDNSQLKAKDEEIGCLRAEINQLKADLGEAKKSLEERDRDTKERERNLVIANEAASDAQHNRRETQRLNEELTICQQLKKTLELELKGMEERFNRINQEKSGFLRSLEAEKAKVTEMKTTIAYQKQTIANMDEKLASFKATEPGSVKNKAEFEAEKVRLQDEMERINQQLSAAKKQVNEEKSAKLVTENRLKEVDALLKREKLESTAKMSSLREEVNRAESEINQLKTENAEMEKLLADAETVFDTLTQRVATLEENNVKLQAESDVLTAQRSSLENENSLLGLRLSEMTKRAESYEERILRLNFAMDATNKIHMEREHKFEVTLLQHGKLIEFLQAIAEQPGKKNKTLTEKLLGPNSGSGTLKNDNSHSDIGTQNSAYRDLEERLEKKDLQIRSLTNQLRDCKAELAAAKSEKDDDSSSLAADVTKSSVD